MFWENPWGGVSYVHYESHADGAMLDSLAEVRLAEPFITPLAPEGDYVSSTHPYYHGTLGWEGKAFASMDCTA